MRHHSKLSGEDIGLVACVRAKSLQSCPTLCDSLHCSPAGSSVNGILQERILDSRSESLYSSKDWTTFVKSSQLKVYQI